MSDDSFLAAERARQSVAFQQYTQHQAYWSHPSRLSVVAFADDITVAVKSPEELVRVARCIDNYCAASRSRLNYKKSVVVYNSRFGSLLTTQLPTDSPLKQCSTIDSDTTNFRYLGVLMGKDAAASQWKKTVDRVEEILRGFYFVKPASIAAACYVNIYAISTLIYASAVHAPPKGEMERLRKIILNKMKAGKTHSPISMEVMTLPRKQGGLGLLDPAASAAGCRAAYWYQLVSDPSFARSTILGAMQTLTCLETEQIVHQRELDDARNIPSLPKGKLIELPCERVHPLYFLTPNQARHMPFGNPIPDVLAQHQVAMASFAHPRANFTEWNNTYIHGGFEKHYNSKARVPRVHKSLTPKAYQPYCKETLDELARSNPLRQRSYPYAANLPAPLQLLASGNDPSGLFSPFEDASRLRAYEDRREKSLTPNSFRDAQPQVRPASPLIGHDGTLASRDLVIPAGWPALEDVPTTPAELEVYGQPIIERLLSFWEGLASLQKSEVTATYTWRLLLTRSLKLVGHFDPAYIAQMTGLSYRGTNCPLCRAEPESFEHLLFDCPLVHSWWRRLEARGLLPARPIDYADLFDSYPSEAPLSDRQQWHSTLANFWHGVYRLTIYYRWRSREPPTVSLKHLVDFLKRWLTRKGTPFPRTRRRQVP